MSRCACCGQPLPSSSHRRAEFSVDDDVLAVCNGAFGIAAATGSGYVDVDHLILALSRYDDGRGLLARAGFDLERAAAAIEVTAKDSRHAERGYAEMPKPQASDRFQDVLRHATARASSRGSAFAAVGDVVAALHAFEVSRGGWSRDGASAAGAEAWLERPAMFPVARLQMIEYGGGAATRRAARHTERWSRDSAGWRVSARWSPATGGDARGGDDNEWRGREPIRYVSRDRGPTVFSRGHGGIGPGWRRNGGGAFPARYHDDRGDDRSRWDRPERDRDRDRYRARHRDRDQVSNGDRRPRRPLWSYEDARSEPSDVSDGDLLRRVLQLEAELAALRQPRRVRSRRKSSGDASAGRERRGDVPSGHGDDVGHDADSGRGGRAGTSGASTMGGAGSSGAAGGRRGDGADARGRGRDGHGGSNGRGDGPGSGRGEGRGQGAGQGSGQGTGEGSGRGSGYGSGHGAGHGGASRSQRSGSQPRTREAFRSALRRRRLGSKRVLLSAHPLVAARARTAAEARAQRADRAAQSGLRFSVPDRASLVAANRDFEDDDVKVEADGDGDENVAGDRERQKRFYLALDDDIVKAPSIGPRTADRLIRAGLLTVRDLLAADPEEVAAAAGTRFITARRIAEWQQQARLVCIIPWLRGTHAQLFVGAGYASLDAITSAEPETVTADVVDFARSREGQTILRAGPAPDPERVLRWVENAGLAEPARAA